MTDPFTSTSGTGTFVPTSSPVVATGGTSTFPATTSGGTWAFRPAPVVPTIDVTAAPLKQLVSLEVDIQTVHDQIDATRQLVDSVASRLDPILTALKGLGVDDSQLQTDLNTLQARLG